MKEVFFTITGRRRLGIGLDKSIPSDRSLTKPPGYIQHGPDLSRHRCWWERPKSHQWRPQQLWQQPRPRSVWKQRIENRNLTRRAEISVISACKTCTLVRWEARFNKSVEVALFRVRANTIFCGSALWSKMRTQYAGKGLQRWYVSRTRYCINPNCVQE